MGIMRGRQPGSNRGRGPSLSQSRRARRLRRLTVGQHPGRRQCRHDRDTGPTVVMSTPSVHGSQLAQSLEEDQSLLPAHHLYPFGAGCRGEFDELRLRRRARPRIGQCTHSCWAGCPGAWRMCNTSASGTCPRNRRSGAGGWRARQGGASLVYQRLEAQLTSRGRRRFIRLLAELRRGLSPG